MIAILPDNRMERKIIIIVGLIAALIGPLLFGVFNKGKLEIITTPAGATVFINGTESGRTPAEMRLKAGTYDLKVTSVGFNSVEQIIKIERQGTTSLNYNLVRTSKEENTAK